jgi:hypothetical protein
MHSQLNIITTNKSSRIRSVGYIACRSEKRNTYKILIGKPKANIPLGTHRYRRDDNTKTDLKDTG